VSRVFVEEFYKTDIEIVTSFEEGSFKKWTAVLGAMYIAIADYGGFRDGIDRLYDDAKVLTNIVKNMTISEMNPSQDQIYRTERRTGVPGILKEVLDDIDSLAIDPSPYSEAERIAIIDRMKRRILRALSLSASVDEQFITQGIFNYAVQRLPRRQQREVSSRMPVDIWRNDLNESIDESESRDE